MIINQHMEMRGVVCDCCWQCCCVQWSIRCTLWREGRWIFPSLNLMQLLHRDKAITEAGAKDKLTHKHNWKKKRMLCHKDEERKTRERWNQNKKKLKKSMLQWIHLDVQNTHTKWNPAFSASCFTLWCFHFHPSSLWNKSFLAFCLLFILFYLDSLKSHQLNDIDLCPSWFFLFKNYPRFQRSFNDVASFWKDDDGLSSGGFTFQFLRLLCPNLYPCSEVQF